MTAELLERAFSLALSARLKSHGGIFVDVRSSIQGLMEGKFGGMTVRGKRWRTPLELTAEQLMVDFGELVLDTNKLLFQQTVSLKNIPKGSVSFTLSSLDLANFIVHPIMVAASVRAIKGKAFVFDRSTASVLLDPVTTQGIITYEGVWAGNGQRYAVTMTTPAAPGAVPASAARGAVQQPAAASQRNVMSLMVSARRVVRTGPSSGTGSYASLGSTDDAQFAVPAGARAAAVGSSAAAAAAVTRSAVVATGSVASADMEDGYDDDPDSRVVAEGLQAFFSTLVINLQGIELRTPSLAVFLPGSPMALAASGAAAPPAAANGRPVPATPLRTPSPPRPAAPGAAPAGGLGTAPLPALLRISMQSSILQLPPLNMKF